jgi:pimeloyl-ACP methyl ester carboxylesterase
MPSIGLTHGMTEIATDLRLHYVTAGTGQRTVVLLHGFPQTWWAWRHVLPPLVDAGLRVVALDYRGAGRSWRPREG